MFHFFLLQLGSTHTVTNRLIMASRQIAHTLQIFSGILPYPISFADTSNGYVMMANGFMKLMRWASNLDVAVTVGITAPTTAPVMSASGSGNITGVYTAYVRWLDTDGNPSNLSPISNSLDTQVVGTVPAGQVAPITGAAQINYADVPVTDDLKVVRMQILRNTNGQASVYYVDVDTTDLTGTTFSSTLVDSDLQVQEAVPLFDSNNRSIANRNGVPPTHIAYLAFFQGRVFGNGFIEYTDGHAEVTFGSDTVQGIGTAWKTTMEGREFYVSGNETTYQISSVDERAQTLTLDQNYTSETDAFAIYQIRPTPIQRRLVYYTEAGLFDAWPATNAFEVEENGDEMTGLTSAESFLFVLQRRHIYRVTFSVNPILDGGVFLAADRGCINNRCWVKIESTLYLMDEQGVYSFSAGDTPKQLSAPIQDLYWELGGDADKKINWQAQRFFHATIYAAETTIRWYVCVDGASTPTTALCFNYGAKSWWLEESPVPVGASCLWRRRNGSSVPILAGPGRMVLGHGLAKLDLASPSGTVRGPVSSATRLSLTDSTAIFSSQAGAPVFIVDGKGKGQRRFITGNTTTKLTINRPWRTLPDDTSVYQIGGIHWLWRGIWAKWHASDMSNVRRLILSFQPTKTPTLMNARIFNDRLDNPQTWGYDWPPTPDPTQAVTVKSGETDLNVDLTQAIGYAAIRLDSRMENDVSGEDYFAVEFEGVKGLSPVRLYEMIAEGATK